jgi:hypothetical protein
MSARTWPGARQSSATTELDVLATRISRLACHQGYTRVEIVSPRLQRLLPLRRQADRFAEEARVKHALTAAGLDPNTIDYLLRSADAELNLAALRVAPGS